MYKFVLPFLLASFLCVYVSNVAALEKVPLDEVQLNKFIEDTQRQMPATGQNHVALVWWVPLEYWISVVERDLDISDAQRETIFLSLKNISLLAAVQADLSESGELEFYSKETIQEDLVVKFRDSVADNKVITPIKNLDPNLSSLLNQIAPLLGAAMGNLGNNFHFFVFDDFEDGNRIMDPYEEGVLSIDLKSNTDFEMNTEIEMPLNSLYFPRMCPNGKEAHVSWKYCPWSGKEPK